MSAFNLSKTGMTATDGMPVRLVYDQEADILEIFYTQICDALRDDKPRVMAEYLAPGGHLRILFEDGTAKEIDVYGHKT